MTEITSDSDLLRHLGLTEADAAQVLYRSRQTINQALTRKAPNYFKPNDILVLRLAAGQRSDRAALIDINAVAAYAGKGFGDGAAQQVRAGYGRVLDQFDPNRYRKLWAVLPNPAALSNVHAMRIRGLPAEAPNTQVVYLIGSELDRRAFMTKMEAVGDKGMKPDSQSDDVFGAQLTMLIGDPRAGNLSPEIWVLSNSGFQRAIHIKEDAVVQHLWETAKGFGGNFQSASAGEDEDPKRQESEG